MREFFSDLVDYGWSATMNNYLMWAQMLMDATDSPDATGYAYTYLMNGLAPESTCRAGRGRRFSLRSCQRRTMSS